MEIERKFLVKENYIEELKKLSKQKFDIEQYYVQVGDVEERYRCKNNKCFHTFKKNIDEGLKREEVETQCSKEEYENNKKRIVGYLIKKVRYKIPYDKHILEFDVFEGSLNGLNVCEIEFDSEEKASNFKPLAMFSEDITFDKSYKNQNLAINGLPNKLKRKK